MGAVFGFCGSLGVLRIASKLPANYSKHYFFMDPEALTPFNGVFASSFALL